jgi:hypothetical protein
MNNQLKSLAILYKNKKNEDKYNFILAHTLHL